jgi:hypothetical protein
LIEASGARRRAKTAIPKADTAGQLAADVHEVGTFDGLPAL